MGLIRVETLGELDWANSRPIDCSYTTSVTTFVNTHVHTGVLPFVKRLELREEIAVIGDMPKRARKTAYVQLRCRPDQKDAYEEVADAQNKDVSEWLRELADAGVKEFREAKSKTRDTD